MENFEINEGDIMLIELKDDWITDIEYGVDQYNDYGDWMDSSCISYLTHYTHDFKINFTTDQMQVSVSFGESDNELSSGNVLKLFLDRLDWFEFVTKKEFCDWFVIKLEELSGCVIGGYTLVELENKIHIPDPVAYAKKYDCIWVSSEYNSDTPAEK
ncbi:MAG: hypothetical protein PHT30_04455 [Bacilli bacterium]|nr:hypothetical protein [Bacilli bacterium]